MWIDIAIAIIAILAFGLVVTMPRRGWSHERPEPTTERPKLRPISDSDNESEKT
jgi:hypothetical protein